MLHHPVSTFTPSQPTPSTAPQPFDAGQYLKRARALGIMLFPSILSSGRMTFGLCAYPGQHFSEGNRRLAEEFHAAMREAPDATATIFEALCADFDVHPDDKQFNERVNALCRARCRAFHEGDRRLIALCKKAKTLLEKDLASTELLCDLEEKFDEVKPDKPTYSTADGWTGPEPHSAAEMREKLHGIRECNPKKIVDAYRTRIANVVAFEKELARISSDIGLTKAKATASAAADRSKAIVSDIAELPATTLAGLAAKAAILSAWQRAGYNLWDSIGEALAYSIADDARMVGTNPVTDRPRLPSRRAAEPCAQVQH